MSDIRPSYSPNILIYLEIGEQTVRLADVLENTATLYGEAEIPPGTEATLVFSVDGNKESQRVLLPEGITSSQKEIPLSYIAKQAA